MAILRESSGAIEGLVTEVRVDSVSLTLSIAKFETSCVMFVSDENSSRGSKIGFGNGHSPGIRWDLSSNFKKSSVHKASTDTHQRHIRE